MTSFAFMFDEVPEPVWNTSIGNCASNSPAATRSAGLRIALALVLVRWPRSLFACGRGRLDQAERANELARHGQAGNREIVDRALGLRAVERVGRDLEFAHAVALDTVVAHQSNSRTVAIWPVCRRCRL